FPTRRSSDLNLIRAARVSGAGALLDPVPGFPVSKGNGELPAVASNGSDYVVVWTGTSSGSDGQIVAANVSSAGHPEPEHLLMTDLNVQGKPAAASDGTNHLIVWESQSETAGLDLVATRVGPDGSVLDAPPIQVITAPGDQYGASLVRGS